MIGLPRPRAFFLTRSPDLQKSLGDSASGGHRLSEETDAVVVLVSEETGMISYAHEGKLVRGLSVEELRSILSTLLVKTSRSDKRVAQQAALEKQLEKKTVAR